MRPLLSLFLVAAFTFVPIRNATADDRATADEQRIRRGKFLQALFEEFELAAKETPDEPLSRLDKPLLRYTNPIRNFFSDGCTYLWLDGAAPVAAVSLSIRGEGKLWAEFSTLAATPMICEQNEQETWAPNANGIARKELPKAPPPAASDRLRLVQFRGMARRFRVIQRDNDANRNNDMRLLAQPIYRWEDADRGVIDGALFAFCETTDPETLLMLEIVQPEGASKPFWRYTIARATSRPLTYYLDDQLIQELAGYWSNPRTTSDVYVEKSLGTYEDQE